MRVIALFSACVLFAACASTPPSAPSAAAVPAATPSRIGQLLGAAGMADAPTREQIERAMGAPDIARHDGAGSALTYRMDSCSLLLLFAADSRNQMRLAEAHPSARHAGEAAPSLEACAAEASGRRS